MAVENEAGAPQVDVVQPITTARVEAPQSNPALELAGALRDTTQEMPGFLDQLGARFQHIQQQRAFADAFKTSGAAFADAVRSGKIAATQNPWYIRAYNEQAARITTRQSVDGLTVDSGTWAERNDPAAYQQRFNEELGKLSLNYTSMDARRGFEAVAQPLADQAFARNEDYNQQRITQQHVQDTTAIVTQQIMDQLAKNPTAQADDVYKALEANRKGWSDTGGTEPQWRQLVGQSMIAAASLLGRVDVLDYLKAPYMGTDPLANQADLEGRPLALQLDQDAFMIDRHTDALASQAYKLHQAHVAGEGAQVDQWAAQTYGNRWAYGNVDTGQLQQDAEAHGFSPDAVVWALDQNAERLKGIAGYDAAQTAVWSNDPAVQKDIFQLEHEADTAGLTPGLTAKVEDMLGRRQINIDQAERITDRAAGQSRFLTGEAHADVRQQQSLAQGANSLRLQGFSLISHNSEVAKGEIVDSLRQLGYPPLTPAMEHQLQVTVDSAAMASASQGALDPAKALEAAHEAGAGWATQYRQRHPLVTPISAGLNSGAQAAGAH